MLRNSFAFTIVVLCLFGVGCGDDSPADSDAGIDAPPGDPPAISIADVTVAEGNTGTATADFVVTLSTATTVQVTVAFTTSDGSASAGGVGGEGGEDYVGSAGTLTFEPGTTTQTVTVMVASDALDESDESFSVTLSNATDATIAVAQAIGTITNDDVAPSLTASNATVTEGTGATVTETFTVSLSAPSGRTISVDVATADQTATAGTDYTNTTATLQFPPGETTKTVTVTVTGDALNELDETFALDLSNPVNATVAQAQAVGTIVDEDPLPTLSIDDVSVTEGDAGTKTASLTVTLSTASGRTVSASFATADDTAASATDYVAVANGTVSFAPGETSKTIAITINGDTQVEPDESLFVNLTGPAGATVADAQGVITVLDDDAGGPSLSINDVSITEGSTGTANATFTVTLSAAAAGTVTVNFGTVDGTAAASGIAAAGGQDFVATSGTLTFTAGQLTKTVTVPVRGDVLNEADENFFVVLAGATNATISDPQGQGTIQNDDAQPSISISNVTTTEGNAGSVNATFTATLSAASGRAVTVNFTTVDGTTTAGADYTTAAGTLTFAAGATTQTLVVPVLGDTLDEANETYTVQLSAATNATILDAQGAGTITDNDTAPTLAINNTSVIEGNAGTTALATFTVTLSAASGRTVTVNFATANGTATVGDNDYVAKTGTLTFPAGTVTQTIDVTVNGDAANEGNQTFNVNLTAPTNATILDAAGVATIINDDSPLRNVSINNVTVTEGNTGTLNVTFAVTLSAASTLPITVDFATSDGTATAGIDYNAATGTVTFAPGQLSRPITVTVINDTLFESNETFFVDLSNPTNANIIDPQGLGTITNNDTRPSLTITNVITAEGDTGVRTASFTVSLSAVSGETATVNFATANGTATAGPDYDATSGTLTFLPGETTKSVDVTINSDVLDEADETFTVALSGVVGATIADASGLGTITDDDALPTISINDVTVTEGNAGSSAATFTVTLSAPSGRTVTVAFATANNTATTANLDYTATSGTLTFVAGTTTLTIAVPVRGDVAVEPDETFFVNLSNPANSSIADGQGVCTITNND